MTRGIGQEGGGFFFVTGWDSIGDEVYRENEKTEGASNQNNSQRMASRLKIIAIDFFQ